MWWTRTAKKIRSEKKNIRHKHTMILLFFRLICFLRLLLLFTIASATLLYRVCRHNPDLFFSRSVRAYILTIVCVRVLWPIPHYEGARTPMPFAASILLFQIQRWTTLKTDIEKSLSVCVCLRGINKPFHSNFHLCAWAIIKAAESSCISKWNELWKWVVISSICWAN